MPLLAPVGVSSPAPRDGWRRAAAADPRTFPTQLPEWLDALCAARGFVDASRLYRLADGRELVLPLAGRMWAGVRVAEESFPYGWGYGGLLSSDGPVTGADVAMVLADLAARPLALASVVPVPTTAALWSAAAPATVRRVPYLTQIVDLDGGFDVVWTTRYKKSTRNYVRKAAGMKLEVRREQGGPVLDTFAQMYTRSAERWAQLRGQPAGAARLLARYRDRGGQVAAVSAGMGSACQLWSAWLGGEPAAVLVVLQHGEHALAWLTAIDRELADRTLATYLVQSCAIEAACHEGVRWFHLGETDAGTGVERYKTKFGAVPVPYDALRLERLPFTGAERGVRAVAAAVARSRRTAPAERGETPSA